MSSEKWLSRFLVVALAAGTVSCLPRLGEEAPETKGPEVAGTACLTHSMEVAGRFVEGRAQDREVAGAWQCFGSAFTLFYKYVRGENRDLYTAAEIARFFEDNFLEDRDPVTGDVRHLKIPTELQRQFMKLKQVFIGGSAEHLSRQELLSLVRQIDQFKDLSLRLNPHMSIFALNWRPEDFGTRDRDLERFEQANQTVQAVARDLGALIQKNHPAYDMDDFVRFIAAMSDFAEERWDIVENLQRFMPVAKKVKKALTGGTENAILPDEWRTILIMGARGYVQFLRYRYFVEAPQRAGRSVRLNYVARTLEDSVSIFEDLVHEKPGHQVSRAEIDGILESFSTAWPAFKTSEVLTREFMRLKQVFFGGALDSFAETDFQNARLKVGVFKAIAEWCLPHLSLLSGEWKPEVLPPEQALAELDRTRATLDRAGQALGAALESGYDLSHLSVLLKEWHRLYVDEKTDEAAPAPDRFTPLVLRLKSLLTEDESSLVHRKQWPLMLGTAGRSYGLWLFYAYLLEPRPHWRDQAGVDWLSLFVDRGFDFTREILEGKPSKKISHNEIVFLLRDLESSRLLPEKLKSADFEMVLTPVLNRLAQPPDLRLRGFRPNALGPASVESLRQEAHIFLRAQSFLAGLFEDENSVLSAAQLREKIAARLAEEPGASVLRTGLTELSLIFSSDGPQALDPDNRLYITPKSRLKLNLVSVERHNLVRALSRLFIASYSGEKDRIESGLGLNVAEAQQAFVDFRSLAVSLDLIEKDNMKFMENRFREANIFMHRSDGNDLASFVEVHEMVYSIISGLEIDARIKPKLVERCVPVGRPVRSETPIPYDCLLWVYQSIAPWQMSSMPELLQFVSAQKPEQYNSFIRNGLKGAGWIPNGANEVKLGDASLLPQLLQYIENVYARFDADGDGVISVPEARLAFPVFEDLFRKLAKKDLEAGTIRERDLLALFTYILKYGKPPGGFFEGIFKWSPWRDNPQSWSLATDRAMIAQILAFIADQINGQTNERMIPDPPAKASPRS
ncbi:MAG: hypothetical protein KF865_05305 [Bdellovibrionaceae bacterium]|nr:hypothetical protein [Pseudobdellovibrionaceae bacterium]